MNILRWNRNLFQTATCWKLEIYDKHSKVKRNTKKYILSHFCSALFCYKCTIIRLIIFQMCQVIFRRGDEQNYYFVIIV